MRVQIDLRWVLVAVSVLALTGAGRHRLVDPIPWEEVTRYEPDDLREVVTDRAKLLAGDPAPFDGWLLAGQGFARSVEAYEDASRALGACYRWREEDRQFADRMHAATVEGLKTCRKSKPRDFAAGAAVGFGACAGVGWAVEGARR